MIVRPAAERDLADLFSLYARARAFMAETGNPHQWGNTNPTEAMIRKDITDGVGYVLEDQGVILAAFALLSGPDPTYGFIEGSWPNDRPYGVIHRMACSVYGKGLGSICLDWCKTQFDTLRIDTHHHNHPMQTLIAKNGFQLCGVIYIENGDARIAYQWDMDRVAAEPKGGVCPGGLGWRLDAEGTLTVSGASSDREYLPECWAELWREPMTLRKGEVRRLVITPGIAAVGQDAFESCINLREVVLPESVVYLGQNAFGDCCGLTSLSLSDGLRHMGDSAFSGCSQLTEVCLPSSLETVGSCAFADCASLRELTIPHGVRSIGAWAFRGCRKLARITVPETVVSIGNGAFYCRSEGTLIWGKAGSYIEQYLTPKGLVSRGPKNPFCPTDDKKE